MMNIRLTPDQAYKKLRDGFKTLERAGAKISEAQKEYCEEWLWDCLHETGSCPIEDPLEILMISFEEFAEENK